MGNKILKKNSNFFYMKCPEFLDFVVARFNIWSTFYLVDINWK